MKTKDVIKIEEDIKKNFVEDNSIEFYLNGRLTCILYEADVFEIIKTKYNYAMYINSSIILFDTYNIVSKWKRLNLAIL